MPAPTVRPEHRQPIVRIYPAESYRIGRIVLLCPEIEMLKPNTERVVALALMKHVHPFWNRADEQFPRDIRCGALAAIDLKRAT